MRGGHGESKIKVVSIVDGVVVVENEGPAVLAGARRLTNDRRASISARPCAAGCEDAGVAIREAVCADAYGRKAVYAAMSPIARAAGAAARTSRESYCQNPSPLRPQPPTHFHPLTQIDDGPAV